MNLLFQVYMELTIVELTILKMPQIYLILCSRYGQDTEPQIPPEVIATSVCTSV